MGNVKNFLSSAKLFIFITLFIFSLIAYSLYHSLELAKNAQYNFALTEAKNSFAKDIIYRKWAALEGGVYVPISDFTPPNPYLNVPNRDVETKEGLKLTLVNPAYLTRMVHGLEREKFGVISHLTSLNPINPVNKPDKWEEGTLKEIEKGIEEKHELTLLNNNKFLRYIAAFKVEEPCLKCHAHQGYKVGDVRGAISVSVPFEDYEKMLSNISYQEILNHLGAAIITLTVLFIGAFANYKKTQKLVSKDELIKEIVNNTDIGFWEYDIASNKLKINKEWADRVGYEFNEDGNKIENYIANVHHEEVSKCFQVLEDFKNGKISEFSLEHRVKCKDGNYKWMLSKGKAVESKKGIPIKMSGVQIDIDKDKRIVESILKHNREFKLIFEYSPLPSSISKLEDGKLIAVNKNWEELSGFKNDEVIGKTSDELNLWKNPSDRKYFLEQILKEGIIDNLEMLFTDRFGKTITALVSASVIDIEGEKFIISSLKDISENKKFERKLKKEKELISYFNYLYSIIDDISEKDFYDLSIEYIVKLTDSKIGFFHEVSEDQKEVILTTWNQQAKEFCKADYKSHYPISEAGNWIDCLKTKSAVIYNDYKNSPNQKGLPLGHVQVEKFMSIATYLNEKPFLIFGVGNKEEDYDDTDARNFELFSSELSKLFEKKNFINKLKESERFISSIVNNLPGFVYRCANDKNWAFDYISDKCLPLTGYNSEEFINKNIFFNDLILPEYQQRVWDEIQEALKKDLPYELEYKIVKKDGNIIWVWERGRGVKDNNGNLLFLEGFITDINEKKELELEIIESEEKFRLIAENTGDVISVFDMELNYIFVSPSVKNILGYTPEELYKIGLKRTLLPQYLEQLLSIYSEEQEKEKSGLADPKRTLNFIAQQIKKDGKIVWTESTVTFLRNEKGIPISILTVSRDITLRKKLENEIKESEAKFRTIFEKHSAAQILIDAFNGKIIDVNQAALNLYGHKFDEFKNKTLFDLDVEPNTENWEFLSLIQKNHTNRFIRKHFTASGDILTVEIFSSVLKIKEHESIHFIITDISEKEVLQNTLIENEKKYRRLVEEMYQGLAVHQAIYDDSGKMIDYKFLDMNKSYERILGIKKEDFLNKTVLEVLPKTEKYWIETFEKVVKTGIPIEYENYSVEFDRFFHIVAYNNQPNQFAVIVTDITDKKRLQMQIEESERRFKRIVDSTEEIFFELILLPEPKYIFLSESIEKVLGYKAEEFYNDAGLAERIIHRDDINNFIESIYSGKKDKINFTIRHISKNGEVKWIEHNIVPSYNEENKLVKLEGVSRDVTLKREYEIKIIESEKNYRALFENMTSGFILFELVKDDQSNPKDLKILAANKIFAETVGKSLDDLLGKNLIEALPGIENDSGGWLWKYFQIAQSGIQMTFEDYSDLLKKHFHVSAFQTKPNRCAVTFIDITEKKIKEIENKKLSLAVEQSLLSIIITDKEGNIEYVNKYFTEKTGYTLDEVKGKNPRILSTGKHSKAFYKNLWNTINSGLTWEGLFYNQKKNGEKFWEHAIISPIKDENNKIISFVSIKQDVTDDIKKDEELQLYRENLEKLVEKRTDELKKANYDLIQQIEKEKELERQLQEALLKEKELIELKVRFFASVSHEFRTPLAGILTSAQMIQRYGKKWSEDKILSHFHNIENTIVQLTKLLDDILLISKADREILKNEPSELNIEEFFNNIINSHYSIIQKDRKINFVNKCSSLVYKLDPKLLNHIVGNLLSNAIKYGFEGTDINLNIEEIDNNLVIEIKDKGIGIPETDLNKIFEPFYRTENSSLFKGTGLGLNIVKRCVEVLKGNIKVESKVNEGSTFTIFIPINE